MDKDTTASTNFAKVLLSELECISHRRTEPPWYVISSGEGDAAAQATERSQASALENQPARVADGATAGDGSAPRSDQEEERRRAAEVALLEAWGRESHRAHQLAEDEELRRFDEEVLKEARRQALTPALQALEEQRRELLRKARAEGMNLGDEERSLRAQKDQARAEAETRARQQAEAKQRQEREKRRLEADERDREKADLDEVRRLAKELEGRPKSATGEMEEKLLEKTRACARDMDLVALAFSGGGIRSATFCLGVLQGLAGLGLLKRFDYLSTVSGGGYIGSWLAAWIKREGSIQRVERQLRDSRVEQAEGRVQNRHPVEDEPEPIFHLRSYSNYLAPRLGLASADSWVLLAIYVRNFLLNQLILLPTVLAALLLPRLWMLFYDWDGGRKESLERRLWYSFLGTLAFAAVVFACIFILRALSKLRNQATGAPRTDVLQTGVHYLTIYIVLPLVLASFLVCWFAWDDIGIHTLSNVDGGFQAGRLVSRGKELIGPDHPYLGAALLFGAGAALVFGVLHTVFALTVYGRSIRRQGTAQTAAGPFPLRAYPGWWILSGIVSGLAAGALLGVLHQAAYEYVKDAEVSSVADQAWDAAIMLTIGPPTGLLVFVFGAIIQIGLMGSFLDEAEREWWASLCGWIMKSAAAWAAFCGLALFGVPFLIWAGTKAQALLGAGWVITAAGGVLSGRSPRTGKGTADKPLEILAQVAPYVFLVGLVVALSWLINVCLDYQPRGDLAVMPDEEGNVFVQPKRTPQEPPTKVAETTTQPTQWVTARTREHSEETDWEKVQRWRYWAGLFNTYPKAERPEDLMGKERPLLFWKLAAWFAGCVAVALLASWCVGVNTFSLHGIYGNRLVRCYLGASRPKAEGQTDQLHGEPANTGPPERRPNPVTGFDPADDLPLKDLVIEPPRPLIEPHSIPGCFREVPAHKRPYRGPYLLVNTALNLVEGDELAWQERKAEAFLMSPVYCGSKSTGYQPSSNYGGTISLGTAVTVSGAAASPNMGYHSSPAVTALLTTFNVRLGGWFGNPREDKWQNGEPQMSLFLLFKEMFGRTNRRSNYVYLSDGGHFENLGVYELVRRHCRYIVVCDGSQDEGYKFDDLGGLVRKCRSDLGVPIELDVTPIKPQGADAYSLWHCVVGKIRYDCLDPAAVPGVLVYIKSSLTGNEPSDVLNYAVQHPPFPHQPTSNQFFTESQFESYRGLGQHVAHEVFWDAMRGVENTEEMSDAAHRRVVERLFSNLHRHWFPPPPKLEESFLESVKAYIELQKDLREEDKLRNLSLKLYPELQTQGTQDSGGRPPQAVADGGVDRERAELHAVSQMLRVMEDAWLGVHLEGYFAHPLNRGWMNVFRRWVSSEVFRRHWLTLRGEYSQDFVRFCENELKLDHGQTRHYPLELDELRREEAWQGLWREFQEEWPGETPLDERMEPAPDGKASDVWLIATVPLTDPQPKDWTPAKYPCGVVLLWEPLDTQEDYELLVWLRGPYRNLGIGRECMKELFPEVITKLKGLPNPRTGIRVRYPQGDRPGSANQIRKEMWLTFFYQYGFRSASLKEGPVREDLILRRSL